MRGRKILRNHLGMLILCLFDWRSSLFLTTSSWGLFLAPGEEVTSVFDSVFIIGQSVSRAGKKTMLMRSRVQCPRGSVRFPLFFGQKSAQAYLILLRFASSHLTDTVGVPWGFLFLFLFYKWKLPDLSGGRDCRRGGNSKRTRTGSGA